MMTPRKPKSPSGYEDLKPYSLGSKLKALRTEKGLTLSRLGAETGFSSALLSKLESERMTPTLPTLAKIAHVFGVDLAYFFSSVTHHSLAITRSGHIAGDRRDRPVAKHIALHHVTPTSSQFSKIVDLPPGAAFNVGGPACRTELTAFVLEGPLHLDTAGVLDVLKTGDCIVLDTEASITFSAVTVPARVLIVFARKLHELRAEVLPS